QGHPRRGYRARRLPPARQGRWRQPVRRSHCRPARDARELLPGMDGGLSPYPALPDLTDEQRIARARAAFERLATRRTCRAFADTAVPREAIEWAIRAAGTAPSGANHQPWHFAVVGSPEKKRAIREAAEAEERRFYGADGGSPKAGEEWLAALDPLGTDAD